MTDFAVKVTVRNARLLRAIQAAGVKSQAEFARCIVGWALGVLIGLELLALVEIWHA